jgi:hypothetical protein
MTSSDDRQRQGILLVVLCLLGIFLLSYILDNNVLTAAVAFAHQRQRYAPVAGAGSASHAPPPLRPPRLAAMVLAHHDPTPAIRQFVASYVGSPYDLFVLREGVPGPADVAAVAAIVPNATFVDISMHFDPSLLVVPNATAQTCGSSAGYRLMCRFMSGPVYWMREFDAYDQVLRFDDDSRFTAPITQSLALNESETYAYALKQKDAPRCVHWHCWLRGCSIMKRVRAIVPQILLPFIRAQLPHRFSGASALAVQRLGRRRALWRKRVVRALDAASLGLQLQL